MKSRLTIYSWLAAALCGSAVFLASCSKPCDFNKVRPGMSVGELQALGSLKEQKNPIREMTMPDVRIFRFTNSSHNSVTVQKGIVTEIHVYDFAPTQDVNARKAALINTYGNPSYISSPSNSVSLVMYWGKVKDTKQGWSAKGAHIVAELSEGMSQLDILKGTSSWEDYSRAIVF